MKNKFKTSLKAFVTIILFASLTAKVSADETDELMSRVGFSYRINHPENQLGEKGALNLMMQPGQEQEVTATITNTSNKEITVELLLNGARTNGHGGLEYGKNDFEKDKSMAYDLTDLVKVPKEIKVPKNSEKDVVLTMKMPEVAFDGIVTGGLQMKEKSPERNEEITETGIVNEIAFLFGITLRMSNEKVEPELEMYKAYPEQANYRNTIFLDIANKKALKMKGLVLEVEITKEGKDEVIYEKKQNNIEMAPNTLMSYQVSLNGEKMIPGQYTAHVLAYADGKEWKWDKNFTITKEEADMFNQEDVSLVQERGLDWKLIVIIISILLFVIACVYFVRKYISKKNEKQKLKSRKKR